MTEPVAKLRDDLAARELHAFLSFDAVTNRYLSRFSGSASAVIVTSRRAIFITDFRYREQARAEVADFELRETSDSLIAAVCAAVRDADAKKVGFEPDRMTFKSYEELRRGIATAEIEPAEGIVSNLRAIKFPAEVDKIRRAAEISCNVISEVPSIVQEGMSERELAAEIEHLARKKGADGAAFDTIALFGDRSSLPHGLPSHKRLMTGDIVLIDLGAKVDGYNSDLTRTWAYRTIPSARIRDTYEVVKCAQEAALGAVRAGMTCRELDSVARDLIKGAGYGDNFGHGLGHGVGLEVHEFPRVSAKSTDRLEEGMVITVEPAVYIPGEGGVRIEDLIAVTATGCDVLTRADKRFTII